MVNVTGVRFQNAGKLFYFDPDGSWPTPGDYVVVETTRGLEFGEVVTPVHELDESLLAEPLQPVVRVATAEDVRHHQENRAKEKEAFAICQRKIAEHKLEMKLVSVAYTFDNSKLLFYFTANGRVDFRSLVKDLAGVFHTRIELRQIGVRDEAKMLGGLGPCGRPICCGTFLGDFQPVSIKMAKEQNLSLNPTKISGVCGRLMCCLKFEEDTYEEIRKSMPRVGREVQTPDGVGVVNELNIIKETVSVRIQKGDGYEIREYPSADVQRIEKTEPHKDRKPAAPHPDEEAVTAPEEQDQPEQEQSSAPEDHDQPAAEKKQKPAREGRKRSGEGKKRTEKKSAPRAEKPAEKPTEQPAEKPADTQADPQAKPEPARANNWKQALDEAIKAAHPEGETEHA